MHAYPFGEGFSASLLTTATISSSEKFSAISTAVAVCRKCCRAPYSSLFLAATLRVPSLFFRSSASTCTVGSRSRTSGGPWLFCRCRFRPTGGSAFLVREGCLCGGSSSSDECPSDGRWGDERDATSSGEFVQVERVIALVDIDAMRIWLLVDLYLGALSLLMSTNSDLWFTTVELSLRDSFASSIRDLEPTFFSNSKSSDFFGRLASFVGVWCDSWISLFLSIISCNFWDAFLAIFPSSIDANVFIGVSPVCSW